MVTSGSFHLMLPGNVYYILWTTSPPTNSGVLITAPIVATSR